MTCFIVKRGGKGRRRRGQDEDSFIRNYCQTTHRFFRKNIVIRGFTNFVKKTISKKSEIGLDQKPGESDNYLSFIVYKGGTPILPSGFYSSS